MLKNVKDRLIYNFTPFERVLKTFIFTLIPFMTFFLIMSDRRPYNYFAFALYGVESVLILIYIIKYHTFVFNTFSILLLAFLGSVLISQLLNFSLMNYPRTLLLLSLFSFIFYQFLITLPCEEKIFVFKLIVLGGLLFCLYFFIYYFKELIHLNFGDRLGRDFSDQNDLAKNLSIFAIISEVLVFKVSLKKKAIYILLVLLFFFVILVTGSISNLLVFSVVSIFLIIYLAKGKAKLWVVLGIVLAAAIAFGLLQLPFMSYFNTRITNMINSMFSKGDSVDNSFVDRFNLALYGLRLFISKPIFGYGYDQVQYFTWGKNAFSHNNFVELLASFGIVGFVFFEALLIYPIIKGVRKNNEIAFFSLLYIFVFQFFLIVFRKKIEYFIIPLAFSFIETKQIGVAIAFRNRKIEVFKPNPHYCRLRDDYFSIR